MSFFVLSPIFTWIQLYYSLIKKQVMEFQKEMLGWLDEATLFSPAATKPAEDVLLLNFDDFIDCRQDKQQQQQHNELRLQDFPDVTDILDANGWMDEKIDLSILDSLHDWLPLSIGNDKLMVEETPMALESIIDANTFSSPIYVHDEPSDSPKIENDVGSLPEIMCCTGPYSASSTPSASDESYNGLLIPSSPTDGCSVYSNNNQSPSHYDSEISDDAIVGDVDTSDDHSNYNVVCIEVNPDCGFYCETVETTPIVRSPGKDLSLLQKSGARPKPYSTKKESRRERKKVQNKEAAARYRTKRRVEDKSLAGEVAALESTQSELKDKHDKLQSEVKYLKSLMREMFKARGLLK